MFILTMMNNSILILINYKEKLHGGTREIDIVKKFQQKENLILKFLLCAQK